MAIRVYLVGERPQGGHEMSGAAGGSSSDGSNITIPPEFRRKPWWQRQVAAVKKHWGWWLFMLVVGILTVGVLTTTYKAPTAQVQSSQATPPEPTVVSTPVLYSGKRFEYLTIAPSGLKLSIGELNALGDQGWELKAVSAASTSGGVASSYYIFIRPKSE